MVAKSFVLPGAPQSIGRLAESSVALWLASWRACLAESVLYGLAGLLPTLAVADLVPTLSRFLLSLGVRQSLAWVPPPMQPDPADLIDAVRAWLVAPSTWVTLTASALLALLALSVLIRRQDDIARGQAGPWRAGTRAALARAAAGSMAWLLYGAILLALTAPLLLLTVGIFSASLGAEPSALLGLLLLLLAGLTLFSIPLTWASVACGFAPFAAVIDGAGVLAAQASSVRRVRGYWVHAAVAVTLPMLFYLGAISAISSLTSSLCAMASYARGGWPAVMSLEWLGWSQWLALLPGAAVLPLASAGGVLVWNDLALRHGVRGRP